MVHLLHIERIACIQREMLYTDKFVNGADPIIVIHSICWLYKLSEGLYELPSCMIQHMHANSGTPLRMSLACFHGLQLSKAHGTQPVNSNNFYVQQHRHHGQELFCGRLNWIGEQWNLKKSLPCFKSWQQKLGILSLSSYAIKDSKVVWSSFQLV